MVVPVGRSPIGACCGHHSPARAQARAAPDRLPGERFAARPRPVAARAQRRANRSWPPDPQRSEPAVATGRGGRARGLGHTAAVPRRPAPVNVQPTVQRRPSVCPHDCPSACALEVEVIDGRTHRPGARRERQSYTDGRDLRQGRALRRAHPPSRPADASAACASGRRARGASQPHRPGTRRWTRSPTRFLAAEAALGPETVWPYYYAGTMGLVMRDGINRLRHAKRYSGSYPTICTTMAWTGYIAGTGRLAGRRSARDGESRLRRDLGHQRGAHPGQRDDPRHPRPARSAARRSSSIDIYRNATVEQADLGLVLRPGTDGALACAVMHVLFRDGLADRDYLARYTDAPAELEAHLASAHARMGRGDHRARRRPRSRRSPRLVGPRPAHLLPPRLRLHPPAQRRGQHARGALHPGGDRRLAASRAAGPSTTTARSTTGTRR